MAKKSEKKLMTVKALVNLKYDENCFDIDDELTVREEDAKEMIKKGYVELLDETPEENEGEGIEEPPGEGE